MNEYLIIYVDLIWGDVHEMRGSKYLLESLRESVLMEVLFAHELGGAQSETN